MAIEKKRRCGYRQIHGLYLTGKYELVSCDRGLLEMPVCPCCGTVLKFHQGIQPVDALKIFGNHRILSPAQDATPPDCDCQMLSEHKCFICNISYWQEDHKHQYWLMWVGADYTMEEFLLEAKEQGVSKKIPNVPRDFNRKKAVILLAKKNAGTEITAWSPVPKFTPQKTDVVFAAFKPQHIDYIINESEKDQETVWDDEEGNKKTGSYVEYLIWKGLNPVVVPDNDLDHHKLKKGRSGKNKFPPSTGNDGVGESENEDTKKDNNGKKESSKPENLPAYDRLVNATSTEELQKIFDSLTKREQHKHQLLFINRFQELVRK